MRDVGCARIHPEVAAWFSDVMDEDGMTDTFSHCHPHALDRFTCWCVKILDMFERCGLNRVCRDQSTNRRYFNEGSRIDYILIDRSLMPYMQSGGQLPGGCNVSGHVSARARA